MGLVEINISRSGGRGRQPSYIYIYNTVFVCLSLLPILYQEESGVHGRDHGTGTETSSGTSPVGQDILTIRGRDICGKQRAGSFPPLYQDKLGGALGERQDVGAEISYRHY